MPKSRSLLTLGLSVLAACGTATPQSADTASGDVVDELGPLPDSRETEEIASDVRTDPEEPDGTDISQDADTVEDPSSDPRTNDTPSDAIADTRRDTPSDALEDAASEVLEDVAPDREPDVTPDGEPDLGPPPCVPEHEICDGLDDDCDAVIDNSCAPCGTAHWSYTTEFVDGGAWAVSVAGGRSLVFQSELPVLVSNGVAEIPSASSDTTGFVVLDHVGTQGGGVIVLWQADSVGTRLSEFDDVGGLLWSDTIGLDGVDGGALDLNADRLVLAVTVSGEMWLTDALRGDLVEGLSLTWPGGPAAVGSVAGLALLGTTTLVALNEPATAASFDASGTELWSLEAPEGIDLVDISANDLRIALTGTARDERDSDVWLATLRGGAGEFAWQTTLDWGPDDEAVGVHVDTTGEVVLVANGGAADRFARALRIRPGARTVTWEASYRYSDVGSASFAADGSLVWSGIYDGPSGRSLWTRRLHRPCAGDRDTDEALVFVLSGQSNMDGHGPLAELEPGYGDPYDEVELYWQSTGALSALIPASTVGGRIGPELSFGREMAAAFPNQRIVLVKYAVGGTNLHTQWHPGNTPGDPGRGPLYLVWQSTIAAAIEAIEATGSTPNIVGMAWMQGESDGVSVETALAYADNLTRFIVRTREDMEVDGPLPFAIGRIFAPTIPFRDVIRDGEELVAAEMIGASWVDTDDLPLVDSIHYNAGGQITLGERLAAAVLNHAPGTPREPYVAPDFDELIPEFIEYEELFDLPVPASALWHTEEQVLYTSDRREELMGEPISRIAYLMELTSRFRDSQWVWISADAEVDPGALAVPVDAIWEGPLSGVSVRSSVDELGHVDDVAGRVEFWSACYTTGEDDLYDHDDLATTPDCYGSMQFHAAAMPRVTEGLVPVFSLNRWASSSSPRVVDVGIGPSEGPHPDWTFSQAASSWESIRLRAFVRPE